MATFAHLRNKTNQLLKGGKLGKPCSACGGEGTFIYTDPVAVAPIREDSTIDSEEVKLYVRILCKECGYVMMFDPELTEK